MNDHLKRIRHSQSLRIWGNLIKKKSQQIVHTFSHLPEHAGVLSNPSDEAVNLGDWEMPQQEYTLVNCRHWRILFKLCKVQVQLSPHGAQASFLQRSLRFWPSLPIKPDRTGWGCWQSGWSPGLIEPPTKCPACWAFWGPGGGCLAQHVTRLAKPGLCERNKSQRRAQTLPFGTK